MKKLMIAAAIVCAAVASQAATVMWSASGITQSTTGGSDLTKYTVYFIDNAAFALDTVTADNYKSAIATAVGTANPLGTGFVSKSSVIDDWADGTSQNAYVIVVDDKDGSFALSKAVKSFDINGQGKGNAATGAVGGWTAAAPEPTSGLLLLLGVAGLALKRRRA